MRYLLLTESIGDSSYENRMKSISNILLMTNVQRENARMMKVKRFLIQEELFQTFLIPWVCSRTKCWAGKLYLSFCSRNHGIQNTSDSPSIPAGRNITMRKYPVYFLCTLKSTMENVTLIIRKICSDNYQFDAKH